MGLQAESQGDGMTPREKRPDPGG